MCKSDIAFVCCPAVACHEDTWCQQHCAALRVVTTVFSYMSTMVTQLLELSSKGSLNTSTSTSRRNTQSAKKPKHQATAGPTDTSTNLQKLKMLTGELSHNILIGQSCNSSSCSLVNSCTTLQEVLCCLLMPGEMHGGDWTGVYVEVINASRFMHILAACLHSNLTMGSYASCAM